MFCSKCGNIMPDGTKFCPSCGAEQVPHSSAVNTRPQFEHGQPLPSVSFGTAIRLFFTNYANFSGRSRRSEYWFAWLFLWLVSTVFTILGSEKGGFLFALSSLWSLATLIPGLSLSFRRLHDVGRSGLYLLWLLLPIVGWIMVIVQYAKDSQPGSNQYGPNPKFCC